MVKAIGSFRDSQAPSWLSGPRIDVPTETPLIDPVSRLLKLQCIYYTPFGIYFILKFRLREQITW
jgi:hypothetical protein